MFKLFNIYDLKQSKAYAGVIIEIINKISRGEPPVMFSDGKQTRGLCARE